MAFFRAILLISFFMCFVIQPNQCSQTVGPLKFIVFPQVDTKFIPKYIFRTSELSMHQLQKPFLDILNNTTQLNPEYVQVYYDRSERDEFVKINYPDLFYGYDSLTPGTYQADVFRTLILYKYGGIYCDMSVQFLAAIDAVISHEKDEFVSVKEINDWGIQSTFIAAYPKHPVIKKMIELVHDMIKRKDYGANDLDVTGPYVIQRAFNQYFGIKPETKGVQGGSYNLQGYHFKFLYHTIVDKETGNFMSLREGDVTSPELKKKFKGYHHLLYGKDRKSYHQLWRDRAVFGP